MVVSRVHHRRPALLLPDVGFECQTISTVGSMLARERLRCFPDRGYADGRFATGHFQTAASFPASPFPAVGDLGPWFSPDGPMAKLRLSASSHTVIESSFLPPETTWALRAMRRYNVRYWTSVTLF
jgi:hypothetical protein